MLSILIVIIHCFVKLCDRMKRNPIQLCLMIVRFYVQFMSQNVQDLGLYEDFSCHDNFNNIPDVDMTFKSFEELFGGDQDPAAGLLTGHNDLSCSSVDREISFDKSENSRAPVI